MSQIIADTYEILQEIGSGGGGVVYLGRHLRLGKYVALKADKRTLSAKPVALRREVDALKNLSHTYIPQVYDFIEQDGTVYTVMDYIEGESLDKSLKRGERYPQAQIIKWACQLLEALCYLHSRPPHGILHSDIKPANVMVTPEGEVRLIDFNIALALGEEGAVRVGFSQGYASPEHYGIDYSSAAETQAESPETQLGAETQLPTGPKSKSSRGSDTNGGTVLLDVRSDVYGLGATLYHLLTGRRPARDAKEVVPISPAEASPAVAAIIHKAMSPNPDGRYQTAEEMLQAFRHLHRDDPRAKRHRRRAIVTAALLASLFLAGGLSCFAGLRGMERQAAYAEETERMAKQALAAVTGSENAYRRGDIPAAVQLAAEALTLDSPYLSQAQKALTDALGVYDLSDSFAAYRTLELPSEPLKLAASPDGDRLAAVSAFQADVFDLETGEKLAELPMEPSALSDVMFLDENRLLYAGEGAVTAYDLAGKRTLWMGNAATALALSADGTRAAAIYKDEGQAYIYDTASGTVLQTIAFQGRSQRVADNDRFADPEDNLLALDRAGQYMAVSFSDGSLTVFDLERGDEIELLEPSSMNHFEGGFFGQYFAFSAWDGQEAIFAAVDMSELVQTGGFSARTPFHLQVDETGICISSDNLLVRIDPETGDQTELAYLDGDITRFQNRSGYTSVATSEQVFAIFDSGARNLEEISCGYSCDFLQISDRFAVIGSRDTPSIRLLKREIHPEAELFSYDPSYYHDEARLSADSSTVMLFSYTGFRLYSREGALLSETELPDAEQIYDQQYRREEDGTSYLEVIYSDGTRRAYSAADGVLLWERGGEKPDSSLYEEFLTDSLRITSPLHGTPEAYDRETDKLVARLETDDYLTYVTQVGDQIITEYVSAQGERYGLLLDGNCQVLARLPDLCDIIDGTLVFDYPSGNLRQSRIYSRQELIALAEQ